METTKIELTEEEARLFVEFQKRFLFMQMLASLDAFNIKGGRVIIHFDNFGDINSVDVQKHYRLV